MRHLCRSICLITRLLALPRPTGGALQMAQDAVKNVRNAVKGLGQDGKYFASSKKGEVSTLV